MVVKSAKMDCVEPTRVPSSRYHTLNTDISLLSEGSMAKLNRNKSKGSPCWTPVADEMEFPKKKKSLRGDTIGQPNKGKYANKLLLHKISELITRSTTKSVIVVIGAMGGLN